jgi:predicted dehydrogenase
MKPEKKTIVEHLDCDISRLYGSLDEAIAYLQEVKQKHPTVCLYENWTGYEDMEMVFEYIREETQEEYESRVEYEQERERIRILEAQKEEERQKRKAQYLALKREFG